MSKSPFSSLHRSFGNSLQPSQWLQISVGGYRSAPRITITAVAVAVIGVDAVGRRFADSVKIKWSNAR